MRSESGQGTVEYVGVLLVVAVLVGAAAGGAGLPRLTAGIASSLTNALLDVAGLTNPGASTGEGVPDAAERAAFDRAVDPTVAPLDRPSLRDVRLELIARHGDAAGRARYRRLVLEDLRRTVPGLGGPTLFATATPVVVPPRAVGTNLPIDARRSLSQPSQGDEGELETPDGVPDAHVVTVSEADRALDRALHPGVSYSGLLLDAFTAIPVVGGATRVGVTLTRISKGVSAISTARSLARDTESVLTPPASASPAGLREGDEVVTWRASRQPRAGGAARLYERAAVVRDGAVIYQGIKRADG